MKNTLRYILKILILASPILILFFTFAFDKSLSPDTIMGLLALFVITCALVSFYIIGTGFFSIGKELHDNPSELKKEIPFKPFVISLILIGLFAIGLAAISQETLPKYIIIPLFIVGIIARIIYGIFSKRLNK